MHSVTGLHIYHYFGHLCEYQLHRTVYEKKPPIQEAGLLLLLEQGRRNEDLYVEVLRKTTEVLSVKEGTMEERAERTLEAMRAGVPILHNGVLDGAGVSRALAERCAAEGVAVRFRGETDLLIRVDGHSSRFGNYSYVVADVKSSRTTKFPQMMQVAYYDWLLQAVQGESMGEGLVIVFPKGPEREPAVEKFAMEEPAVMLDFFLQEQLLPILRQEASRLPYHLVAGCRGCYWTDHCEQRSQAEDNLSQLPGLRPAHKEALAKSGLATVTALAAASDEQLAAVIRAAHLPTEGSARIRPQAAAFHHRAWVPRAPVSETVSNWLVENNRRFGEIRAPNWMNVCLSLLSDPVSGAEFGIAVQVGKHSPQNLMMEEPGQEDLVFSRFLAGMRKVNEHSKGRFRIFHFGAWDARRLLRLAEECRPDALPFVGEMILHLVDLQAVVRRAVYLPGREISLHALAGALPGGAEHEFRSPCAVAELDAKLEAAGWEPSRFEGAHDELAWAAGRIGVPPGKLLGLNEELPGVWYRMHLERRHALWLSLVELCQHDGLWALNRLSSWAMSDGVKEPAKHVGV